MDEWNRYVEDQKFARSLRFNAEAGHVIGLALVALVAVGVALIVMGPIGVVVYVLTH